MAEYRTRVILLVAVCIAPLVARANIVVELRTNDQSPSPIGEPVAVSTELAADILLSATADEAPITDLAYLRFDPRGVSGALEITGFEWTLDDAVTGSANYFTDAMLLDDGTFTSPPSAVYISFTGREEGRVVDLQTTPVRIAIIRFRVLADATLDVLNSTIEVPNVTSGTDGSGIQVGYAPDSVDYSISLGNLEGGTQSVRVIAPPPANTNSAVNANSNGAAGNENGGGSGGSGGGRGRRSGGGACGLGYVSVLAGCTACGLLALLRERRRKV